MEIKAKILEDEDGFARIEVLVDSFGRINADSFEIDYEYEGDADFDFPWENNDDSNLVTSALEYKYRIKIDYYSSGF